MLAEEDLAAGAVLVNVKVKKRRTIFKGLKGVVLIKSTVNGVGNGVKGSSDEHVVYIK